jgi:hypothetical protein
MDFQVLFFVNPLNGLVWEVCGGGAYRCVRGFGIGTGFCFGTLPGI